MTVEEKYLPVTHTLNCTICIDDKVEFKVKGWSKIRRKK